MDMAGLQQVSGIGGPQENFPKAQQGIEAKVQKTEKKVDSLFDYIFPNIPSAHAETHIDQQIHKQDNNVFVPDPNLTQTIKLPGGNITVPANMQQQYAAQGGVFEYTTQEKADKFKAWKAQMLAEGKGDPERQKLLHYEPLPDILKPSTPSMFMQAYTTGKTVEQIKYEQEENRIQGQRFKVLQEIEQVQNAMIQWQDDGQLSPLLQQKFAGELARLDNQLIPLDNQLFNLQNPSVTKPPVVGEPNTSAIPETEKQRRKREHEEAKAARKNKMRYYTSIFKSKTKPQAVKYVKAGGRWTIDRSSYAKPGVAYGGIGGLQIAMSQNMGGTFGMGSRMLGTREGNMIEALRQAQMATIDPNATRRTNIDFREFSQSALGSPMAQRAAGMAYLNMERNVSSGAGFSQSAIAAGVSATASYQNVTVSTPASIRNAIRNKDGFNNSLGGLMMNELNSLKGSGSMVYSSAHRSLFKSREFRGIPGKDIFREAVRLGMKGNVEFMDMIKAIPDVDREADNNMQQAYEAIRQAEVISNDYISMVNSAKTSIGFTDSILRRATAEGHSGSSMYANISLLSATKRTNFNNTEIIEESKSKLDLTNSQIFAIRFNSTRGDTELQDRIRYVDQLEAMSSGTSPL